MNRPIKFRAWDTNKKSFRKDWFENCTLDETGLFEANDDDLILMQSTGLLDKNGKEIYEGDVVCVPNEKCDPTEGDDPNILDEVFFFEGCFRFRDIGEPLHDWISHQHFEVIGNIYENPELLDPKK